MCYLFIFKITVVWHLYFLFNPRNCTLHIITLPGVASTSIDSNDLVAPVICLSTRFDWETLANCIPHLKEDANTRHKKHLFGDNPIVRASPHLITRPQPPPVVYSTRSRTHNEVT